MKNSKKGATLAMAVQAMTIIFLMFMIMSAFVVAKTISITKKNNFIAYKTFATQLGYDVESMTVNQIITKYQGKGFTATTNTNTKVELKNDQSLYVITLTMDTKNPADGDKLTAEFKINNGIKLVFVGEYEYDYYASKYDLTSWKFQM